MKDRKTGERKAPEIDYEALMRPARPGKWDLFVIKIKRFFGLNVFLCGTCRWDWRGACHNRERPNATWCPDYQKKS